MISKATTDKKNNLIEYKSQTSKSKLKKQRVLSSDDEDDIVLSSPVNKPKQKLPEKRKIVNPIDVFGSEPVKQSAIKVLKRDKKKEVRLMFNNYEVLKLIS